ncbi:MAG: hypothetical protein ACYCWE_08600 [Eubacteriales bacterium]
MVDYFKQTPYDAEFYNIHIKDRLLDKIIDMHNVRMGKNTSLR